MAGAGSGEGIEWLTAGLSITNRRSSYVLDEALGHLYAIEPVISQSLSAQVVWISRFYKASCAVAVVGGGRHGKRIAAALLERGYAVRVLTRQPERALASVRGLTSASADPEAVLPGAAVVVLAVLPHQLVDAAMAVKPHVPRSGPVISLLIGVLEPRIAQLLAIDQRRVVRVHVNLKSLFALPDKTVEALTKLSPLPALLEDLEVLAPERTDALLGSVASATGVAVAEVELGLAEFAKRVCLVEKPGEVTRMAEIQSFSKPAEEEQQRKGGGELAAPEIPQKIIDLCTLVNMGIEE
jgi:hypothetical protein